MSGSEICSQISWPKYYQEEKLGVSSATAMEQSRLYSEDGFAFAASLPTSLLLASSTLARTIVDPGREGQDIIITSVRSSTLLMVSELLRTGSAQVTSTKGTINEVKDLMEMLGISANLDVVGSKVVPVSINNQEKNKLNEVGALSRDHLSSMVHDFSQGFELSSESEDYRDSSAKEDVVGNKVGATSINLQEKNKLKEGDALGLDHPSSIAHDFSQVYEVSTESEDYSDSSKEEEKESRMKYKLKNCENSVRSCKNGLNLRKRSSRELILRSGPTNQSNKRMKLSSKDDTKKTDITSKQKILAEKFCRRRNNEYKNQFVLDIQEVSSDTEDEYASKDVDKNNNELQEVHDEWKTDYQQPVGNQSVEDGVPIEGIRGSDSSLERKTHECSAIYPPAVILPESIVPSDFLWQGSKEEFLSMFGLCTHAEAEQIRARTAAVSAGRSKIRIRRSRKEKNRK